MNRRLAVIPSDPLDAYLAKGIGSKLREYYNPGGAFETVYVLSPHEHVRAQRFGMEVIPTSARDFAERLRELRVDAVRAYGGYWPADLACGNRTDGVPVIVSVHDTNPDLLHDSVLTADYVLPVSAAVHRLLLRRGVAEERIIPFRNRIDLALFRPLNDDGGRGRFRQRFPGEKRILHIGRRAPQKNLDTLLRALSLLGGEFRGIFIGQGDDRPYRSLAHGLGIDARCTFLPSVPNEELPEFYSYADCFCVPSRYEGFGMVFLEALASGAAVVSSDISPINDLVEHGRTGWLVSDFESPESVAAAIRAVTQNPVLESHLRLHAREGALPYRREAVDALEASIYERVLAQRERPAVGIAMEDGGFPPRVSVVMPVHNDERFLEGAIRSVLAQTWHDFELIIVDDGSTDGCPGILGAVADPRVRTIRQDRAGLPGALNRGFAAARGELLTWVSSDNTCEPVFLETLVAALDAHPGAAFASSRFALVDEAGRFIRLSRHQDLSLAGMLTKDFELASFLYRRTCLETVGGYDPDLLGAEDWDMWIRIVERFPAVYVHDVLMNYRLHRRSMTSTMQAKIREASARALAHARARLGAAFSPSGLIPGLPAGDRALSDASRFLTARFLGTPFGTAEIVTGLLADDPFTDEPAHRFLDMLARLRGGVDIGATLRGIPVAEYHSPQAAVCMEAARVGSGFVLTPEQVSLFTPSGEFLVARADTALAYMAGYDYPVPSRFRTEAETLIQRGDHSGARRLLDALLVRNPDDVAALIDRSVIESAAGDRESAAALLVRALALDPGSIVARENLDLIRLRGRFETLLADLDAGGDERSLVEAFEVDVAAMPLGDAGRAIAREYSRSLRETLGLSAEPAGPTPRPGRTRGISFCIITNGKRPQKLLSEIQSIRALDIPEYEILVGGDVPDWVDGEGVRIVPMPEVARAGRLGEMRNRLCREARFGTLVVADDDMVFHAGFDDAIGKVPEFDALAVKILNPDGTRFWDWATAGGPRGHRLLPYGEIDAHIYVTGGMIVIRAEVARAVRWDDSRGMYKDEDVDFSRRLQAAGHRIACCPDAVVTHDDPAYTQQGHVVVRSRQVSMREGGSLVRRPIVWAAPFFNPSGYASEAIGFVLPLMRSTQLHVKHDSALSSSAFVEGLPQAWRVALEDRRDAPPPAEAHIFVAHNPAHGFRRPPRACYCIGRTMFETDRIPADWVRRCELMDEIWVPSAFNIETFSRAGVPREKLVKIPGAIDTELFNPGSVRPADLPNRRGFNFLSVFEWTERKGWDVLLRAYFDEFTADDDVCLHLRTYLLARPDGSQKEEIERRIAEFARSLGKDPARLPAVEVLDRQLPTVELPGLYRACDAFVSASRGEGWGRPLMEAMAMGMPVIATGWSGNTEFMNGENSYLIDIEGLSTIARMEIAVYVGHRWAEPSAKHLRRLMRRVVRDRAEAGRKGRAARRHILRHYSMEAVSAIVLERLQEIERTLDRRGTRSGAGVAGSTPLVWEGDQFSDHSLAIVNRAICTELIGAGENPVLVPPDLSRSTGRAGEVLRRHAGEPEGEPALTVRHAWPPDLAAPKTGHWVMMQPWEFGPLPAEWARVFRSEVDDVWVYSRYLRDHYVRSGIPAHRVGVIPLGVDPERFARPGEPYRLATAKTCRFLFVGGTIARKGIDVLLEAYTAAFTAADDVCLVVKEFGGDSVYRGQTARERIEDIRRSPGAPEIEYIDAVLSERQMTGLYRACTALVHPYRAEGFALPIAEAMAAGLPVVATGAGAALDYLNDDRAYLISARMVTLPSTAVDGVETVGHPVVAEPDRHALAALLRRIAEHPDEARRKGELARAYVLDHLTWRHTAAAVRERLRLVRSRPIVRFSGESSGTAGRGIRENHTSVLLYGEPKGGAALPGDDGLELITISTEGDPQGAVARSFAEAVGMARGDVIVLLRAPAIPAEGCLRNLRRALFARPGYGLAAPLESRSPVTGVEHRRIPPHDVVELCVMVRRDVAEAAALEPESTAAATARNLWTAAASLGLQSVVAGDATVLTEPPARRIALAALFGATPDGSRELLIQRGLLIVRELEAKGDLEAALDVQRGLVQRFKDPALVRGLGWLFLRAGWPAEARSLIEDRSAEERAEPGWLLLEGYCAEALEDTDRAEACAAAVLQARPLSSRAAMLRGLVALRRGDGAGAERSFRAAIVADPSAGGPRAQLGSLYWSRGEREAALEELERAFQLSPRETDIAATYTDAAAQLGAAARARELVEEALRLHSDVRFLHQLNASFLLAEEKPSGALRVLLESMARFGVDDDTLNAAVELRKACPATDASLPRLSLAMIVRDEQANLARCLWSVLPVVDEIVVVDTGSSDRTVDVAAAFGARIVRHVWDRSFASARNAGLAAVRGAWTLVLDADEVIAAADHDRLLELVANHGGRQQAYRLLTRNYVATADVTGWRRNDGSYNEEAGAGWIPSLKVRLFPRDARIRFEGVVHELVENRLERAGYRIEDAPVVVHHYGKLDRHRTRRKGLLYRELGAEKLRSGEEDSPEAVRELAVQEEELGNFAEAFHHWKRYLEMVPDDPRALLGSGTAAIGAGDIPGALEALERACRLFPGRPEPRIQQAIAMMHAGRLKDALASARQIVADHPASHHARALLALVLLGSGDAEEGLARVRELQDGGVALGAFFTGHARRFLEFGPGELVVAVLQPMADAGMITADQGMLLVEAYRAQADIA